MHPLLTQLLAAFLLAASLCADCFAVATCSAVTLGRVDRRRVWGVAALFGLVHIVLLFLGWCLGDLVVGYVERVANWVGFALLLFVGGSMVVEAVFGDGGEVRDLSGLGKVLLAAVATSIDAFAVGVGLSMDFAPLGEVLLDLGVLFTVTVVVVAAGISGGGRIGEKFGRWAAVAGGVVLVGIGVCILLGLF